MEDEDDNVPQKGVRLEARQQYLCAAACQENRYQKKVADITTSYNEGDTVGIKWTEPTQMSVSCSVKSKKSLKKNGKTVYWLYTYYKYPWLQMVRLCIGYIPIINIHGKTVYRLYTHYKYPW